MGNVRNNKGLKEPWLFINVLCISFICFYLGYNCIITGRTSIIGKHEITLVKDPMIFYISVGLMFGFGIFILGGYLKLKYQAVIQQIKQK